MGLVLGGAVLGGQAWAGAANVSRVRLGGDQRHTRLVIDADGPVESLGVAFNATSMTVSILLSGLSPAFMTGEGRGLADHWRLEPESAGRARFVMALASPARVDQILQLTPGAGSSNWRFVIDLAVVTPLRIVIDPGHGGGDVGAQGAISYEKNVTLAAGLALRASLAASWLYAVSLTRTVDRFVPLAARRDAAAGSDLFLSLHADASSDITVSGASAYTISDRGVERALGRMSGIRTIADPTADGVLLDLRQRGLRNRSAAMAESLLLYAGQEAPLLRRSHREAGFLVLTGLQAPTVLFEMGFMTNREDEKRLNDPVRQARLAACVARAIDEQLAGATVPRANPRMTP